MNANKPKASKPPKLRPRTGIKAGDIYMQNPRGSNNGSNGGG
jgi:hypothetical protein